MSRLKRGSVEDLDTALDLRKMARLVDRVGEVFEEETLTRDEAVWVAALSYLSIFNATDSFASTELLVTAARALLKEAADVFDSMPEPGVEAEDEPAEPEDDEPEDDEEGEDEDYDDASGETELPDAGE